MTETHLKIKDGLVVSLDYALHLGDGQVIDSSADGGSLEILQGEGQVVRGLEQALYGMAVGDEKQVVIAPADGYGAKDPDALVLVPRNTFPTDLELRPGTQLHVRDQEGNVFATYVVEVRPDGVLLDFNHPLAGETLHFDISIVSIRPATQEELSHGHAHDAAHDH